MVTICSALGRGEWNWILDPDKPICVDAALCSSCSCQVRGSLAAHWWADRAEMSPPSHSLAALILPAQGAQNTCRGCRAELGQPCDGGNGGREAAMSLLPPQALLAPLTSLFPPCSPKSAFTLPFAPAAHLPQPSATLMLLQWVTDTAQDPFPAGTGLLWIHQTHKCESPLKQVHHAIFRPHSPLGMLLSKEQQIQCLFLIFWGL